MIRRATLVLSLATAMVGIWMIIHGHSQDAVCNSYSHGFSSDGVTAACSRIMSSYFMGVAMTIGGFTIALLVSLAIAKRTRKYQWGNQLPTIPKLRQHAVGTLNR